MPYFCWRGRVIQVQQAHIFSVPVSGVVLVYHLILLVWYRCPVAVAWILGKCIWTEYAVRPDHEWKHPFLIAAIQVDGTIPKDAAWIYLIRYGKFVVWPTLLACLVVSTCRFCFLVYWLLRIRGQVTVWWSLHTFSIMILYLVMLTVCSSKIDLNPA